MKLLVCSDLHLDDLTYGRMDKSGHTFRTVDHMSAFDWVVTQAIDNIRPDVLAITGDIYESPLPPNNVSEFFNRQLVRLSEAGIKVRIIVGNHDCGKFHSALQPLRPLPIKGLSVCVDPSIEIGDDSIKGNTMLYLPYSLRVERKEQTQREHFMEFASSWREKAASMGHKDGDVVFFFSHFGVSGALMNDGFRNQGGDAMTLGDMDVMGADYSMLGDYHGYQPFRTAAGHVVIIPGSLERTDFGDVNASKGFILYDSSSDDLPDTGKFRHVPYPSVRRFVKIDGDEPQILSVIESHKSSDDCRDAVVRITFTGTVEGYRTYEFKKKDIKDSLETKMGAVHVIFEDKQHDPEQEAKAAEIKEIIRKSNKMSEDDTEEIIRSMVRLEIKDEVEAEKAVTTAMEIMEEVKKEHGRQESSRTAMAVRIHGIKMHNFLRYGDKDNIVELDQGSKEILSMPVKRQQWMKDLLSTKGPELFSKWNSDTERRVISITGMTDGDPKFSNGSGKSSIFEGISYAFFERLVREFVDRQDRKGVSTVSIVSKIRGDMLPEAFVEVLFSAGGAMWLLRRGRKSNRDGSNHSPITNLECIYNTNPEDKGSRSGRLKAADNDFISSLIGMDYDTFANSVMFGQNDSGKFIKGTDKMRKDILINVLHLWMLEYCLEKTRAIKRDIISTLDTLTAQTNVLSVPEDKTTELRGNISKIDDDLANTSSRIGLKTAEIESLRDLLSKTNHDNLSREVASIEADMARMSADVSSKRSEFERRMSAASRAMSGFSSEMEGTDREKSAALVAIGNADKAIAAFDEGAILEELDLVKQAKAAKPVRREQADGLIRALSDLAKDIGGMENEMSRGNAEIKKLKSLKLQCHGGLLVKCSSCNSMVGEDHLDKEISAMEKVIAGLNPKMETLKGKERADRDSLNEISTKIYNCDKYISNEAKLLQAMAEHGRNKEKVVEQQAVVVNCDNRMVSLTSKREESMAELEAARTGVEAVEKSSADAISGLRTKFAEAKARLDKVESEASSIRNSISRIETDIKADTFGRESLVSIRSRLETQIDEIAKKKEKVAEINAGILGKQLELIRIKVIEKAFGINGLPSKIIERYLPLMNSYVAEYLDVISNHKIRGRMYMDPTGEIMMEISGEGASQAELLSGGELMKVKLAFSIALGMLSFVRSANAPEFICLDEIFAPVDTGTKDYVFQTIEKLKEHFRDIIVISHDSVLMNRIRSSIVVNKVDGISRIERQYHETSENPV